MSEASARRPAAGWIMAARPKTLFAALGPVVVAAGVAAGEGPLRPLPLLATAATALMLQVGANLANDVTDFWRGADRHDRAGPTRAAQAGWLTPRQLVGGAAGCFAAAEAVSLYLGSVSGPVIPVLCLLAIAAALAYTGGPWPYGYHGLGDVFVFLFFGPASVLGAVYVQTRHVGVAALAASVAVGLLVDAVLVINNLRDLDRDRATGKRTLAVWLGPAGTRWQYAALLLAPQALPLILRAAGVAGRWFWLPWLSLPLAVGLVRSVHRTREPAALNRVLARTGALQLLFGALVALGQVR